MPHSVHSTRENTPDSEEELALKYWNTNISPHLWTAQCPPFLVGTSQKNQMTLSARDDEFEEFTWQEVKHLISEPSRQVQYHADGLTRWKGTNRIDQFQRPPLQLRRYLKFMHDITKRHGSIMTFVQKYRLQWSTVVPSQMRPFTNPKDYKILYNDWPYGLDKDIVHLVVWTKFELEDDPMTGDLTPQARREIEEFVLQTFCGADGSAREQLVWFKNWKSLKSIHALGKFINMRLATRS
jgi:hypothetical protein